MITGSWRIRRLGSILGLVGSFVGFCQTASRCSVTGRVKLVLIAGTETSSVPSPQAGLVVSLSALDLKRWYAFQCYMKAMDVFDEDMHMDCDFVNPGERFRMKYHERRSIVDLQL
ncbi:unnamed protein product [Heligmosomoides polygyrus]|uniref:CUB domain-containing protein n=1 Tax=Heligmosomoides polygyrus TaxID=6339 RepID=A0A183FCJ7_HELPZ|nr:unnamed protein product [Heligmosomoides polygyrus]